MAKFGGLGERLSGRFRLLGYWKRKRPDVLRFCREKDYRPQYVYAWLKDRVPSYGNLRRLAADLQVSPAWILFGKDTGDVASPLVPPVAAPVPGQRRARGAAAPPPGEPAILDVRRLRDVMERLVQLEAEMHAIFQAFPDGYFWLDREGTVIAYKAGRGFEMPVGPERFLGHRLEALLPPAVAEPLRGAIRRTLGGDGLVSVESCLTVRERPRTFETRMVALPAPPEGDRRVLAIVRDITERKRAEAEAERGRREVEVVAALARDITASLDLDTVLQRTASAARELCESDAAWIALREPGSDAAVFRYQSGLPDMPAVRVEPGKGLGGRALLTGRPARTDDYAADALVTKDYLGAVKADGAMAELVAPIRVGPEVEGLLYVFAAGGRRFGEPDEVVLSRLADHAAIAIRNARVYAESERRRRAAEELAGSARALTETLDVQAIGARTVAIVRRLLAAEGAGLRLLEADGTLRLIAKDGPLHAPLPIDHRLPPGAGLAGTAARTGRPASSDDVQADPALAVPDDVRGAYARAGAHAALAVPLRVRGAIIGTLAVAVGERRRFEAEEVALLTAFADQAALALGPARLLADVPGNFT